MKAIYLDDQVHRRIKLLAARRGRPLKDVVESLLERALADEGGGSDVTTAEVQALAARGGSFDFLADDREEIYTLADGDPVE